MQLCDFRQEGMSGSRQRRIPEVTPGSARFLSSVSESPAVEALLRHFFRVSPTHTHQLASGQTSDWVNGVNSQVSLKFFHVTSHLDTPRMFVISAARFCGFSSCVEFFFCCCFNIDSQELGKIHPCSGSLSLFFLSKCIKHIFSPVPLSACQAVWRKCHVCVGKAHWITHRKAFISAPGHPLRGWEQPTCSKSGN